MNALHFEWDQAKNAENRKKHGVGFEEAASVFYDENARLFFDPDHSKEEDRFILLGMSLHARMLIICHCHREADSVIRIISARKADRQERKNYSKEGT